jgi:hypothetical protein
MYPQQEIMGSRHCYDRITPGYILVGAQASGVMIRSGRSLDSAVMTTWAESRISHGLLVVVSWITDQSTDVALAFIVLVYHMPKDMTHS